METCVYVCGIGGGNMYRWERKASEQENMEEARTRASEYDG